MARLGVGCQDADVTYGIAMANPLYAAIVTDRRTGGVPLGREDFNKPGVLCLRGARLGYTISGLAEVGGEFGFNASFWVAESLLEAAKPGLPAKATLSNFQALANEKFEELRKRRVRAAQRRFSVLLAGFAVGARESESAQIYLVSNYERLDRTADGYLSPEFCLDSLEVEPNSCKLATTAIDPKRQEVQPALDLLKNGSVPPEETVYAAVRVIRARSTPGGAVGGRCSSLVIPASPGRAIAVDYHPDLPAVTTYSPNLVYARYDGSGAFCMVDAADWGEDQGGAPAIMAVPRVPRNWPCPCGSGSRYRHCHGRRR